MPESTTNSSSLSACSSAANHRTPPMWTSAVPPLSSTAITNSSSTTRIHIAVPPVVSGRGRTQITSATAAAAISSSRRPPLSSSASFTKTSTTNTTTAAAVAATAAKTTSADDRKTQQNTIITPSTINKSKSLASSGITKTRDTTPTTSGERTKKSTKKKKNKSSRDWPFSSADSLPPLSEYLVQRLQDQNLEFPINEECTALTLSPSGRLLIACFSDGTLRLFDLTGTFTAHSNSNGMVLEDGLFDMDSSSSDDEDSSSSSLSQSLSVSSPTSAFQQPLQPKEEPATTSSTKSKHHGRRNRYVLSKEHQRFGTVASQIHAKGVITSLLMDVDVAQDGEYCFAGVLRGSMELMAVHLGKVEEYLEEHLSQQQQQPDNDSPKPKADIELLDLITVFSRSDAKLRGFGACTRLRNSTSIVNGPPQYLLFTGKAIKNIHIWKFEPPLHPGNHSSDDAKWVQLYDTQTNGNTITYLQFRYDPNGLLQGISKSDDQKLRVWDLSYEQHQGNPKSMLFHKQSVIQKFANHQQKHPTTTRPKRPPFCDVTHSESTLAVCGGFSVCCGTYNQMSILSLDIPNVQSPFNHTELALPVGGANGDLVVRTNRRQQRGELKSVVSVAGMSMDPAYILLEVSDGSIIQYSHGENGQSKVEIASLAGFDVLPQAEGLSRKMCVAKIGSAGVVAAAIATYNNNIGRGKILLRPLNSDAFRLAKKQRAKLAASSSESCTSSSSSFETQTANSIGNSSISCASPHGATDISKWTHPPSAISDRNATTSTVTSTPSHGRSTSVQLFGSELKEFHVMAAHIEDPPKSQQKASMMVSQQASKQPKMRKTKGLEPNDDVEAERRPKMKKKKSLAPNTTSLEATKEPNLKKRKSLETNHELKKATTETPLIEPKQKKRKSLEPTGARLTPSVGRPVISPQSTIPPRPEAGKSSPKAKPTKHVFKAPTKNSADPKVQRSHSVGPLGSSKLAREEEPARRRHSLTDLSTTSATSTDLVSPIETTRNNRVSPLSTVQHVKPSKSVPLSSKQKVATIPATPTDGGLEKKSPSNLGRSEPKPSLERAKKVSPDSKETRLSAEDEILPRKDKHSITQFLTATQAQKGAKPPAKNTKPVRRPELSSSPLSKKRSPEDKCQKDSNDAANALCHLGSTAASKTKISGTKRTVSEVSNPDPASVNASSKTSRGKNSKSGRAKSPAPCCAKKNQPLQNHEFLYQIIEQEERLAHLKQNHLPSTTVEARMGLLERSSCSGNLLAEQELARINLAAQHRASHELLLKRVLQAAQDTVQAFKQTSTMASIEEVEEDFRESFRYYYEMLDETLWMQSTEASNLANQQKWERQGSPTPVLQVSFPFNGVFNEVLACVEAVKSSFVKSL